MFLQHNTQKNIFNTKSTGASQQFLGLDYMRKYKILVPDEYVLNEFNLKLDNIFKMISNLNRQNENLIKQRDLCDANLLTANNNLTINQQALSKMQADVQVEFGITLPKPEDRFFADFYSQYNY